ncbi:MAG: hypothetical protein FWC76_08845, partial [Defluviitaleaceae bacterium]|nr:hypothetical protein [Defluviitaleaceae bacterium]
PQTPAASRAGRKRKKRVYCSPMQPGQSPRSFLICAFGAFLRAGASHPVVGLCAHVLSQFRGFYIVTAG